MKVLTRSVHKGPRTLDEASINRTLLMIVIYPLVLFWHLYQISVTFVAKEIYQ